MNKKSVFAEFPIKITSSSLPTFYDTFRPISHCSIHTLYLVQLINKSLNGILFFLPKRISISIDHKYEIHHRVSSILATALLLKSFVQTLFARKL